VPQPHDRGRSVEEAAAAAAASSTGAAAGDLIPVEPAGTLRQVRIPRVYMMIVDQIRNLIETGVLAAGDKLPTERVLSDQLGVSRSSMREALTALEVMGIIDSRPGSGNYIARGMSDDFADREFADLIAQGGTNEILETRSIFEPGCAAFAAQRHTQQDLEAMARCIATMERQVSTGEDSWDADWGFHRAVAAACQNPTTIAVYDLLTQRMSGLLWQVMRDRNLGTDEERPMQYLHDHREIYDAISSGDAGAAGGLMRVHVARIAEDLADAAAASPAESEGER
jgi:GntR family transcriptional regulator, transcriptional repressor for pyruvate dehydrogenase complex